MRANGEIKWRGQLIFISEVLTGEPVGLAETDEGRWIVNFGPVELGIIDGKARLHRPRLWT